MARDVGGDYFKYFRQREAIIRGRRLIEGRLLLEENDNCEIKTVNLSFRQEEWQKKERKKTKIKW